ncbi:unnamed protein product [Adineta ricciae]|nr:unnamed protein product [Adineta ricciae]
MTGWQLSCANTTCLPFATTTVLNIRICQTACLNQAKCKTATFHQSSSTCDLFSNIPSLNGSLVADMSSVTMLVMAGTRIPPG